VRLFLTGLNDFGEFLFISLDYSLRKTFRLFFESFIKEVLVILAVELDQEDRDQQI